MPAYSKTLCLCLLLAVGVVADSNTLYVISNAEDTSLERPGLTEVGTQRANECLPNRLGPKSAFDIGYIITCTPNSETGDCITAVETVQPLADALGIPVDSSCPSGDQGDNRFVSRSGSNQNDCVKNLFNQISNTTTSAILICWQLEDIDDLADALNINNAPDFPRDHNDVLWTVRDGNFISQTSEGCPGIDGQASP